MRNVDDATILVTGATDGLGKRVARELAGKGATVLLHGRDSERLEAAPEEIRKERGSEGPSSYLADLSSLAQVRAPAGRILSDQARLDVLINNASVIVRDRKESEDGFDLPSP